MTHWQNKNVLMTGVSSGIGSAICQHALAAGANIFALCRRQTDTLTQLQEKGLAAVWGDVSKLDDVQAWYQTVIQQIGQIDIVINNAGLMYYADCTSADYEQMVGMINTNCLGFVNLSQVLLPQLKKQQRGHWINITSDAGKQPYPGLAVYSGTKAFVEFCSRAMRQELLNDQVKFTNIQPGNVQTKLHQLTTDDKAQAAYGSVNAGQYLSVTDIVQAVNYAVSTPHGVAVNEILVQPLSEST